MSSSSRFSRGRSYDDNVELFMAPKVSQYGNHMVMTNVVKETKTKYINIDSKFCDDSFDMASTQANYNFTLPEKITDIKSLNVENIEFPCQLSNSYNISSLLGNNCFQISIKTTDPNGGEVLSGLPITKMIIIPDGNYTRDGLCVAINQTINTTIIDPRYNVNYVYFNNILYNSSYYTYIYSLNGHNITYTFNFAVDANGNFDKYNFKSKLGWLLGFRNTTYSIALYDVANISGSGNLNNNPMYNLAGNVSTTPYDFSYNDIQNYKSKYTALSENVYAIPIPTVTKYYYLVIDEFSNNFQNSFISTLPFSLINKYVIAKISVNPTLFPANASNDVVMVQGNNFNGYLISGKRTYSGGKIDVQKLNVKIIDENGNIANLHGYDFSFCLKIEYE